MSKVRGGQVYVEIGADPRKLFKVLGDLNKNIGRVGASMMNLGARMTALGTAMAAPLALAARQFATFDDAIRATAAVSGASGAALQSLNDKARELGATTSFTAVQVANLMTELGRAGFAPDQIEQMTGAVLNLARATGTDATLASGIMAAAIRQFSLDAGDAARVADVLTKAANSTFNTVEGLGESLKYAGPVAKSLGMSLEDTVAVLGVLGNVGIQGSEAGTALRRLSVIAAGSGEELEALFGISNTDAAGNLKPLVQVLDEINTVTANMPVAERTAKMAKAFGLLGITSANVLSQSAGGVRDLSASLKDADGVAARTAAEMDAGLGGAMRILTSAVEGVALAIGDALAPSLQALVEGLTAVAGGLTAFIKNNQELIVSAAKGIAIFTAVGGSLLALGSVLKLASFSLGGLATAFVALPVAIIKTVASLGLYIASTAASALTSAASAATIAASWIGSALAGVLSFVGSAVAGLASYVGAAAAAAAASAVSAAAAAAAWLAPLAPFALLAAAIGGAAALAYSFGGQIKGALSGVGDMAGAAANTIGGAFSTAVSDAGVVLGDLATTATTTFEGIYDAIAAGDLAGAMDVLWAGLYAGWLRGVEAIMGAVDPWLSMFQNAFTVMGAEIAKTWDSMWTAVAGSLNMAGAFIQGAFDNIVNGVMAAFDSMVSAVRKSWNWVQSFIKKGFDLAKENAKVDSEMAARARERDESRPGMAGRTDAAARENAQAQREQEERAAAIDANTQATIDQREEQNRANREQRRADTVAAEGNVGSMVRGKKAQRAYGEQAAELLKRIQDATTIDQLRDMYGEFDALAGSGKLTDSQASGLEAALEDAQERISRETGSMGSATRDKISGGAGAAGADAAASKSEVAGTFSAMALGGLGFGSSLAEQQLNTLKKIESNTREEGALAVQP
jgi:TP901 family phage tail tape measure protein